MTNLRRQDLIYPELSYLIMGCAYRVHNHLGGGLKEDVYQDALACEFKKQSIRFTDQPGVPINYDGKFLKRKRCDFVVEDLIAVEIKSGTRIKYKDIEQTKEYINLMKYKLGLLIVFGREYVKDKRVLNLY